MNNDASVGGAAVGETGRGSSLDPQAGLNSSDQLEENISGEYEIPETRSFDEQRNLQSGAEPAPSEAMSAADRQLAKMVKERLVSESTGTKGLMAFQAEKIQVTARNGEIYLSGSVPSEQHKMLVEIRAAEAAQVQRVHNQLTVENR